jgi:predicted O-methyltransferase YrrM
MREWPDIAGWCKDCDRQFLYDLIVARKARFVLEIGVYAGRMTVALAEAVRVTGGVVHCVDPWQEMQDGAAVAREFLATVTAHSLQDVIRIHAETSAAFAARWYGDFDFAWIDGGHRYEDAMADLCAWVPRSDALYGHDWHLEGVRKAAQDYAGSHGMLALRIENTDNIWTLVPDESARK